jgi:cytidine deaminase
MSRAREALARAYSHYSKVKVGVALLAGDGRVFTGCNVENASFGLTLCAERTALAKAVSEGARRFVAMAIATDRRGSVMPCGACRQFIAELAPRLRFVVAGTGRRRRRSSIQELLPHAFGPSDLA